jgi:hypothetical protein
MFTELQAASFVLQKWKDNPQLTKRQIGGWSHWKTDAPENDRSLTTEEVESYKQLLREHNPSQYYKLFPK